MRRLCCECKTVYGEKCGVCGSSNIAIERHADTHPDIFADLSQAARRELFKEFDRFLCLDCGEIRPRGFGGDSHGYCVPCRDKVLAGVGARAMAKSPAVVVPVRDNGRLASTWFRIVMAANRAWTWFQNFGVAK